MYFELGFSDIVACICFGRRAGIASSTRGRTLLVRPVCVCCVCLIVTLCPHSRPPTTHHPHTRLSLPGRTPLPCFLTAALCLIRAVFQRARASTPSIVFLDEVDAMVGHRGIGSSGSSEGVSTSVLATLLNEMDGVEWSAGVLVVGATNRVDMLDPALLRWVTCHGQLVPLRSLASLWVVAFMC
jgi:hypothetical protein